MDVIFSAIIRSLLVFFSNFVIIVVISCVTQSIKAFRYEELSTMTQLGCQNNMDQAFWFLSYCLLCTLCTSKGWVQNGSSHIRRWYIISAVLHWGCSWRHCLHWKCSHNSFCPDFNIWRKKDVTVLPIKFLFYSHLPLWNASHFLHYCKAHHDLFYYYYYFF